MKIITDEEYISLCISLNEKQYGNSIEDYDMEWIPSEPEVKKPKNTANNYINLTTAKLDEINEKIFIFNNLQIAQFKIYINRYNGVPSSKGTTMTTDIICYEQKLKTPSGMPCKMEFPINFVSDNRFNNKSWITYFNGNKAHNIPIEKLIDIIRWFQALDKLSAFI